MSTITFEVPGDAVSFQTKNTAFKRGGNTVRGTRKTDAAADWEAEIRRAAAEAMAGQDLLEGPVQVVVHCWFVLPSSRELKTRRRPEAWKDTRPDLDKIVRLVLDGMEGVVYPNDSRVARLGSEKFIAQQGQPGRTVVKVRPLEPVGG